MNIAVTDGIDLMPPVFLDGLDDWSSTDGTPGSPNYDGAANATIVASDPDFGSCLEIQTISDPQALRYMAEVPILPGTYIEVSARIKVMSGAFPSARIAAWAGKSGGVHVSGLDEYGPSVSMDSYGRVYTVKAIIGSGKRSGVDMSWGITPTYGHFGLDLDGAIGSVVRIEDVQIKDVTSFFLRNMMDWVDVRDYGAVGDGITNDRDAFQAADNAASASGRDVLVSKGVYRLNSSLTFNAGVRFEGTLKMNDQHRLLLTKGYDLPTYVSAFNDEKKGFKKALQALFNYTDHESLDMGGMRIQLDEPIDVHSVVANKNNFANRRVIRNGQLEATASSNWNPDVVNATANYSTNNNLMLTNVSNIASIAVGSLVTGNGVGREIYVTQKDESANTLTISQPLHSASNSQSYTFTRFKYLLDFSGFNSIQRFQIEDVEFGCFGKASALMLPKTGLAWHIRDCWFTKPADRGITSIGTGCNGMSLDANEFISNEYHTYAENRKTICYNTNSNDIKVRNNRSVRFLHFGVMNGGGHIITGNHFWQGDSSADGERSAGLIITQKNCKTTISANYIDNAWIELNNEHDVKVDANASIKPFGTISLTGNIFTASDVPSWFTYFRLAPYGNNHGIDGVTVSGNAFKTIGSGGPIDRIESVDTTEGTLDNVDFTDILFEGNSYDAVNERTESPAIVAVSQSSTDNSWSVNVGAKMPFEGRALSVDFVTPQGAVHNGSNAPHFGTPIATPNTGAGGKNVRIDWSEPVKGKVHLAARVDKPV